MNTRDLPGIESIRPGDLRAYLRGAGWTMERSVGPVTIFAREVDVPRDPDDPDLPAREVVRARVVGDPALADYRERMSEVVELLATIEKRPTIQVLNDLLTPPADVARFRISGDGMAAGVVSFADSLRIRSAVGELLLASAHSVLQPRPHHPQLSLSAAKELFNQCYEGPFERSSFVASVVVPVPPVIGGDPDSDPYPRRVTQLLIHALHRASKVAESGHPEELLQLVDDGISANFLEALAALSPPTSRAVVDASISWSPLRPAPRAATSHVRIHAESFPLFAEAARVLRERRMKPDAELTGYVMSVARSDNDVTHSGKVIVACELEGVSRTAKVQMTLPAELYQIAVDAHARAGMVRVIGMLRREPRSWMLDSVSLFEAVSAEDA